MLQEGNDPTRWLHATIDSLTDETDWWTVGITPVDHNGTVFINGQHVRVSYQRHSLNKFNGFLTEKSAADADVAGDGQIWVRDRAANQLWFTDDTGDDYPVAMARGKVTANASSNLNTDTVAHDFINGIAFFDDGSAYTITLEDSTDEEFPVECSFQIINGDPTAPGTITITEGATTTLYYIEPDGTVTDTAGGCTMSSGAATVYRSATGVYFIWGSGITA